MLTSIAIQTDRFLESQFCVAEEARQSMRKVSRPTGLMMTILKLFPIAASDMV